MIRIAVLDDNNSELENIKLLFGQFAALAPRPFGVEYFSDPFALLQHVQDNGGFDLYVLDVLMPALTGLEVASRIRERGERCQIIFLTASREYGVEAFAVDAAGYLVKPVSFNDFRTVAARAFDRLPDRSGPDILVRTGGGLRKISAEEIIYVESFNHHRQLRLRDGAVDTPETLSLIWSKLKGDPRFYCPHRAYIVNIDYVIGIRSGEITMSDCTVIPVSKQLYRKFREYYLEYCFKD